MGEGWGWGWGAAPLFAIKPQAQHNNYRFSRSSSLLPHAISYKQHSISSNPRLDRQIVIQNRFWSFILSKRATNFTLASFYCKRWALIFVNGHSISPLAVSGLISVIQFRAWATKFITSAFKLKMCSGHVCNIMVHV